MKFTSTFILLGLSCVAPVFSTPAPSAVTGNSLEKRYDNARMTYYNVGLGACGQTNTNDQFVVALNSDQYDNGSHCGQKITISYGGKSTTATIVDECPGCPYAGLDLSPSLFQYFAPLDKGVIYGTWNFA